jgi:hypothetical protein
MVSANACSQPYSPVRYLRELQPQPQAHLPELLRQFEGEWDVPRGAEIPTFERARDSGKGEAR